MDQTSFIHQFGIMLHMYPVGEKPKFTMADKVIVDVGSGDLHIHN
jgi:hypothetical protein